MAMTADDLDGRIGEAWSGVAPDGSHINLVIARRGSPTAAAIAGALASPRPGHIPFLACVEPGQVVRPMTVVVNKSTMGEELLDRVTWGAAQLGISQGVLDALAEGTIDPALSDLLLLLVAVWVDPAVTDETAVRIANREATRAAIADAVTDRGADHALAIAGRRDGAHNGYYTGR